MGDIQFFSIINFYMHVRPTFFGYKMNNGCILIKKGQAYV